MDTKILKEKILEAKLNLFRCQTEKNTAANKQQFEKAAYLRDQQKQITEHIEDLKIEVLQLLEKSKDWREDKYEYAVLLSLILEFQPIDFLNDTKQLKSIEAIDVYVQNLLNKNL